MRRSGNVACNTRSASWWFLLALLCAVGNAATPSAAEAQSEFLDPDQYGIGVSGFVTSSELEGSHHAGGRIGLSIASVADLGVSVSRFFRKGNSAGEELGADFTYHLLLGEGRRVRGLRGPRRQAIITTVQYARNISGEDIEAFAGGIGFYAANRVARGVELIPALIGALSATKTGPRGDFDDWQFIVSAGVALAVDAGSTSILYLAPQATVGQGRVTFGAEGGLVARFLK